MKIKGVILFIALFGILLGCISEQKTEVEQITYQSKIFTEKSLIDYVNKNPELNSEDSVKYAEALDKFQREIKGLSNNIDFLVDFPLQATNIRDTVMGTQNFKIATFETYTDALRDKNSLLNRMELRINGIFQFDYEAKGLVLGGKYYLKALIYKQGKRKDVNYYKKSDGSIYVLGVYPMQIKKLKPVLSNNKIAVLN
ncbi:hypothetical protein GM921_08220 [Pedobacter sp. LMG 31464]|uniref:Uncharacterized protein n=1 Tax=Pedobacter planticolens TaxID=2679964 RepID=A0A923E0S4_9SPHI|nr:hypothetical protein [Pedobacter planticolens]MBB2145464.1 hypothetical protein [Pedobacter planticolens]